MFLIVRQTLFVKFQFIIVNSNDYNLLNQITQLSEFPITELSFLLIFLKFKLNHLASRHFACHRRQHTFEESELFIYGSAQCVILPCNTFSILATRKMSV